MESMVDFLAHSLEKTAFLRLRRGGTAKVIC